MACRRSSFRAAAERPPLVVDPTLFGIRPFALSPCRPAFDHLPLVACRPSALWSTTIYHYHATLWFVNLGLWPTTFRQPFGRRPCRLSALAYGRQAWLSTFQPTFRPCPQPYHINANRPGLAYSRFSTIVWYPTITRRSKTVSWACQRPSWLDMSNYKIESELSGSQLSVFLC